MKHRLNERIKNFNITILISLFLLLSCGSGQLQAGKDGEAATGGSSLSAVISISRQLFLDAFVSFGNLLKGLLGLTVDTTKKEVGEQLGKLGEAVQLVKVKLEELKGNEQFNLIKDKAESTINKAIGTLGKIFEGASKIKDATGSANGKVGGKVDDTENAAPANTESVKGLVEGINLIYEAAKEIGVDLKGNANKQIEDSKEIAKLFKDTGDVGADAKALSGAKRAVIAASGSDILAAIEAAKDTSKQAGNISAAKNAYDIAVANKDNTDAGADVRDKGPVIAAGLALRAMAKDGKLATVATHAPGQAVNAVLIGVVGKTVNEIVSIVRRTVDKCLKDVDDCIKEDSSSVVKAK
ncbi:variable large family protein [Borrelia turicatae]|uniref:Variable large protein n=1 Tax=Borrelia turicatae (strain 91E135) TaxID=314724 RepID=A0ABF7QZU1_BORT9|nr:variable large family protein [Borrelia turicatae]ASJ27656.1 VlpE1 [Borrelia turicatae 91E135]ASJ27774.1 VlpE1 [Borrelia turicatae 91E135]UPA14269.1 variable large family protein [Borrelia turicatae 91E135]UPA14330.1 variable large family protein [Borrelia turicatae 91E135]